MERVSRDVRAFLRPCSGYAESLFREKVREGEDHISCAHITDVVKGPFDGGSLSSASNPRPSIEALEERAGTPDTPFWLSYTQSMAV